MSWISKEYIDEWKVFLRKPPTILSIIGALFAGAIWLYGPISKLSQVDLDKLLALLAAVKSVDEQNIVFKASENVQFKIDNRWTILLQKNGDIAVYDGEPGNSPAKFSANAVANY
jgi:hypothetical protein